MLSVQSALAQVDTVLIEGDSPFVLSPGDTLDSSFYLDSTSHNLKRLGHNYSVQHYQLARQIDSPLPRTKFLVYRESRINPSSYFALASYKDTLIVLVKNWTKTYGDRSILDFINSRLAPGVHLDLQQLYEIALCINQLSSVAYFPYEIISEYDQMGLSGSPPPPVHPPDTLRSIIQPLTIRSSYDDAQLDYFAWNGSALVRVRLLYHSHRLQLRILWTWNSGRKLILL